MRVVLDTNVLVAAFVSHGLCSALLEACIASQEMIVSDHILAEAEEHLGRKAGLPHGQVKEILDFLRSHAELAVPCAIPAKACRDKDDLAVLGTAVAGRADCLVSGDADLRSLKQFRGIDILSPRQFYDRLTGEPR